MQKLTSRGNRKSESATDLQIYKSIDKQTDLRNYLEVNYFSRKRHIRALLKVSIGLRNFHKQSQQGHRFTLPRIYRITSIHLIKSLVQPSR